LWSILDKGLYEAQVGRVPLVVLPHGVEGHLE
jgi:hypothetical protein